MIAEIYHFFLESRSSWTHPRKPRSETSIYDKEFCEQYSSSQHTSDFEILNIYINQKILANLPNRGKFLDIACGPGSLLIELAKQRPEVSSYGIDVSPEMLNIARDGIEKEMVSNIQLILGDMNQLSDYFKKQEFDFITWNFAAHYCQSDDQVVSILNTVSGLLKPNGMFVFTDLVRFKRKTTLNWFANKYDLPVGRNFYEETRNSYLASYTPDELRGLVDQSFLKDLKYEWSPGFPVLFSAHNLKVREKAMSCAGRSWTQKLQHFLLRLIISRLR